MLLIAVKEDIQKQPFADVLKNRCLKIFTGILTGRHEKNLCWNNFIKKRLQYNVFLRISQNFKNSFQYRTRPVDVSGHLYYFLILFFLTFPSSPFFFICSPIANSCRMTWFFPSVLIIDIDIHGYSKQKIYHQQKEHVLLAKLKEECQENFNGEVEAK